MKMIIGKTLYIILFIVSLVSFCIFGFLMGHAQSLLLISTWDTIGAIISGVLAVLSHMRFFVLMGWGHKLSFF
jgi:hypothetical protein